MESVDYTPSATALAQLPQVDFVAIIGPTAVGKTTLLNAAIERDHAIHLVVVTTNRLPRPGERNDVDYHFRTKLEIQERLKHAQYVQVAPTVLGYLYATAPEDYATSGVAIMPVIADSMRTFLSLPFKRVRQVYVLPPNWDTWEARIKLHHFTPEQLIKRMEEAQRSLSYAETVDDLLFIQNSDLERSTNEILQILQGGPPQMSQAQGRILAHRLKKQLQSHRELIKTQRPTSVID